MSSALSHVAAYFRCFAASIETFRADLRTDANSDANTALLGDVSAAEACHTERSRCSNGLGCRGG